MFSMMVFTVINVVAGDDGRSPTQSTPGHEGTPLTSYCASPSFLNRSFFEIAASLTVSSNRLKSPVRKPQVRRVSCSGSLGRTKEEQEAYNKRAIECEEICQRVVQRPNGLVLTPTEQHNHQKESDRIDDICRRLFGL